MTAGFLLYGGATIHPVDARNNEILPQMHLQYAAWNVALEPLLALWKAMNHAADIHMAMISYLLWGGLLALVFTWLRAGNLYAACRSALAVAGVILLYDVFMLMMPPAGWRLVIDEPGMVTADLHSHSYYSHDSFLAPLDNLRIHRAAGFDVVAITDHNTSDGAGIQSRLKYSIDTLALEGIERHDARNSYLIAIVPRELGALGQSGDSVINAADWVREVHDVYHGVVIAMYINQRPEDIARLQALGVDAFEVANRGHPRLPEKVRDALNMANSEGIPLIASSDLHGWGIDMDTWTVFRRADVRQSAEDTVLTALRDHRYKDIIPVSSHGLGEMTLVDSIVAPFSNAFQYIRALSFAGLMSWWIWAVVLFLVIRFMESRNRSPSRVLFVLFLFVCGSVLLWRGVKLLTLPEISIDSVGFHNETGALVCAVGVIAMFASLLVHRRGLAVVDKSSVRGDSRIEP